MGGARALIASLGASFSLVAGAALSLLVVSFVFAYDGITGGVDAPPAAAALVLESQSAQAGTARGESRRATPIVIKAQAPAAQQPAKRATPRPARTTDSRPAAEQPAFNPGVRNLDTSRSAPAATAPATRKPAVGDGVIAVGEAVTATVQGTGKSAGLAATPILGPPVAQAVQDVLDLLVSAVQGATGTLAGVVDTAVPR